MAVDIKSFTVRQTEPAEFVTEMQPRDVQVDTIQPIRFASMGSFFAPAVTSGAASYIHTQASPSAEWIINHNFGFKPNIELRTVGGAAFDAEVIHMSNNQARVYLATAIAGEARCI